MGAECLLDLRGSLEMVIPLAVVGGYDGSSVFTVSEGSPRDRDPLGLVGGYEASSVFTGPEGSPRDGDPLETPWTLLFLIETWYLSRQNQRTDS